MGRGLLQHPHTEMERRTCRILRATSLINKGGQTRLAHEGTFPIERLIREMESKLGS